MKSKIFWLDTETTGLDPREASIIQLAGLVEVDGKLRDKVNVFMRPFEGSKIAMEALEVNRRSLPEITRFPEIQTGMRKLKAVLGKYVDKYDREDKFVPAGYNVGFDVGFLRKYFERQEDPYFGSYFFTANLDVLAYVAWEVAQNGLRVANHKLETVCGHFGIKIRSHDAMGDITSTRKLFYKLNGFKQESLFSSLAQEIDEDE